MIYLIGGIRGVIAALAGASAMYVALSAYDVFDDRAVAKEARAAQLVQFEADSAKALANALLIAGKAQSSAVEAAQRDQLMTNRMHESQTAQMEAEIAALETNLAETGRTCLLDQSDVDRVRNSGRKAQGSGK